MASLLAELDAEKASESPPNKNNKKKNKKRVPDTQPVMRWDIKA